MRLLRASEVQSRLGWCKTKHYALVRVGQMTKPINSGGRSVFWPEHEVDAIVAAHVGGLNREQISHLVERLHAERQERAAALLGGAA